MSLLKITNLMLPFACVNILGIYLGGGLQSRHHLTFCQVPLDWLLPGWGLSRREKLRPWEGLISDFGARKINCSSHITCYISHRIVKIKHQLPLEWRAPAWQSRLAVPEWAGRRQRWYLNRLSLMGLFHICCFVFSQLPSFQKVWFFFFFIAGSLLGSLRI